jgi:hypothetical protein
MSKERSGGPTAVLDEKRVETRIETSLSATVITAKRSVPFTIDNLSASGARLIGPLPLTMGERVRITLAFDKRSLELMAEVVRVHSPDLLTDQVAVRFVELSLTAEASLRSLVIRTLQPGADGSDVDDERVTGRLPMKPGSELDAATTRYSKKKSSRP